MVVGGRTDDSNVAIGVNFGVAPSSSWSKSGCNLEMGIMRIGALQKSTAFFKGEHLQQAQKTGLHLSSTKGKPLRSHMVG